MAIAEPVPVATAARPRPADPAPPAASSVGPPRPTRLAYLDTLKVTLTALVIAHHAGQAYGPTGGRWPIFEAARDPLLGPFFAVNAAFFMGLFFLVSALFVPSSFDRKGAGAFLRDRVVRLGIPLVFFALVVFAPVAYADYAAGGGRLGFLPYLTQVYVGRWQVELGHLWFLAHLLVYGLLYTAWRVLGPGIGAAPVERRPSHPPTSAAILAFTLALAGATFLVRIAFPIDRWINPLGVVPTEVAHLPQYAALFAVGILAARRDWLRTLPARTGMSWLALGAAAAATRYAYPYVRAAGADWLPGLAGGGLSAASMLWSTWEAFICVGLCVGLIALFREWAAVPGRLMRAAAPNAFAAYVVHVLPVVGLQFALAGAALPPLAKFVVVTAAAVPLCFLLAAGLRRLPGGRSVL